MAVTLSLLTTLGVVVAPTSAFAAGTVLFQNAFNDKTVDGTGTVTIPATASGGANSACLTASGGATLPLISCSGTTDSQGGGKLQLTPNLGSKVGGVFGQGSFPTSNGLDVTFNSYQWGGPIGADGMAFVLAAVDPANPVGPGAIGTSGGALGYSAGPGVVGLTNAYLGIGLDPYGNFSNNQYSGTGCSPPATITAQTKGAVVVRGPGSVRVGYCGLTTTYDGTPGSLVQLHQASRAASVVPVEVLINPTSSSFTTVSGIAVDPGTYKVVVTPIGSAAKTLTGPLPSVAAGLYPSASWLSSAGIPKQLSFGFVGSTGSVTDNHEVSDVKALTFNPVPQLGVATNGFAATTSQPGDPVTYSVVASVLSGQDESMPISVSQTVPVGVLPVGAFGTGWVCATPVGQTITCTTSGSSFANNKPLPTISVVGIVTGTNVAYATVLSSSTTRASSGDANPGTISTASSTSLPNSPSPVTVSPAIGPITGGGSVSVSLGGLHGASPTAIEIGTTAEQTAGSPVVLLPCPTSTPAAGCFAIDPNNQNILTILSMPPRANAAVKITLVTWGVAGAASYVYADRPGVLATPTAAAGTSSATLTWVAPAVNGSAITSYVVTPYLGGVAQSPQTFDASTTTRTFSGLTAGSSYAFTVAAINAYGTSDVSAKSAAVIPYVLPGAPTISAVSAGTSAATLTWAAPASNGFAAISGYVVTPFIGVVAQTPQVFASSATTQTLTGLSAGTAYTFKVAAQNAAGTGPVSGPSAAVTPNVSPSLTFAAPPAGEVGVAYGQSLAATAGSGTSPYVYSLSAGVLPPGLSLGSSTGLLSGSPTASGSSTFTVRVVDASAASATRSVTLVIAASPTLTVIPLAGEVGVPYSQQPVLAGGTGPFAWAVSAGSLPPGVVISSSTGLLSGTPSGAGTFSVTIAATDSFAQVAASTVVLVIAAPPTFSATVPPGGQVAVAYPSASTFDVAGGTLPLAWSVSTGALPPGLSLNAGTGVLSGTPTAVGSTAFTVSVVDANGKTAAKPVTLVVGAGPLVITKTANVSSTVAGGIVGYTITITNSSSTVFTGVALADPLAGVLDDAAFNNDAAASAGSVSYAAATLGWTGNIAASAVVTITYSVRVNKPDVGDKVLANTVTSSTLGANCASGTTDPRCTAAVTVAGLTIVNSADVATTTPGATVHFTVVVTNTGPVPYLGAALSESLADMVDDAGYNSDATTTLGNVAYTAPNLTWTGDLAVGAVATISYSLRVANPDANNKVLAGTVLSASPGSPCPVVSPGAVCTATVAVLVPALTITSSAGAASTTPGTSVAHTVTIANTGQTPYAATSVAIALAGALDDANYNNDAATTAGAVSYTAPTLTWTGGLAIGASTTITYSLTVKDPDPGDHFLSTVVTSGAAGASCPIGGTSPACVTSVQVLVPELTITKAADVGVSTPGSVVHYTVRLTNTGQTPYTGATVSDPLGGVLDDAGYNGDGAASAGAVSYSAPTLTWTGNLGIGATATITYSVRVSKPDTGDKVLTSTVSSATPGATCPVGTSNPACTSSVAVLIPALSILLEALAPVPTTPGSVVPYKVTVVNTGQSSYTGTRVSLDLSGAVDDATYNNDAAISTGDLVVNPASVDWALNLAVGATATGTLSLTVKDDPAAGDRSLVVAALSDAPGSTCPAGSSAAPCRSVVPVLVPGLTIAKTASASSVTPGDTVGYTVTVVNNGQTSYPAASFTDNLATVLTDATYVGGATTASSGTVSYTAPVLSWSGTLAPGATATITYSVVVRDPDPGDKRMISTVVSTAAGNNCKAGSTDPACTTSVSVLVPALSILKTADATTTTPGASVGYTITLTNSGATAYTGASFADSLAGVLDDATYNGNAAAGVSGGGSTTALSFASPVLTWTGDLAVGATATITYSVTVHTPDNGDNRLTNAVTSTTRGNNCAAGSVDPRCTNVVKVAALVIQQSYAETSTTPGSLVHLIATFTNTGQVPYTGITITSPSGDTVDDAVPTGNETASSGTLMLGATAITWTGDIPVGGVVTIIGTLTVKDPDPGNKTITGTLVSTAPGNNCPTGGTDPLCKAAVSVLVPALSITKTANTTSAAPRTQVVYTITVANTGQSPYAGAVLSDSLSGVLDEAAYNGDAAASSGALSYTAPSLSWTGDLAVGATVTIVYSVTVGNAATGDKILVNTVSSTTVGSTCPPASGNPACRSTVVVLTPALTIVKTANVSNATLGSTVIYTVNVTNTGQTPYPVAAFTDSLAGVLDDATYNGNATATSGTLGYTGGVLSWTGALPVPGNVATITYSVGTSNTPTADQLMTNTVASASIGSNCAAGAGDTRCTATVAITEAMSLTFTKTSDAAASSVAGAVVGYTVTATNSSAMAVTSASFTDPLAGIIDDATYNNDASASVGAVLFTSPDLTWTGDLAAGATASITYTVTVHATVTGDQRLGGTLVSTSPAVSNNCLLGSTDTRCTNTVTLAGLLIVQSYPKATTTPGSVVALTATFTNTGQTPYTGITVTSPLAGTVDDAIPTGDQLATSGTLAMSPTSIIWTGNIPIGGVVTITGTLRVMNPDTGNKVITGTLVSAAPGNNCPAGGTDPGCTATVTVLVPALRITKTASAPAVAPGATLGYTITVTNTGQTPYTSASGTAATLTDTLVGVVDEATYNNDASAHVGVRDVGPVTYSAPSLSWTGDLAVGASAIITYSVTVAVAPTGDKTLVNTVSSTTVGATCPPAGGPAECHATVLILTPALSITSAASAASAVPGQIVTYTLTATNTGQTPYPAASINVPLGGVLDDATFNADSATATAGTATFTAPNLAWTGPLASGAAATITYSVTVNNPVAGNFRLDQRLTSPDPGSTCPTAGSDPRCATSVPIASLHITNTADVTSSKPTGVVVNTVRITNTGQVPYIGISVTDDLAGSLDDATYNGDAANTGGGSLTLDPAMGRITWTGDLPVGATTVTATGSLTVNNPDPGNKSLDTVVTTDAPASNCPTGSIACTTQVPVLIPALRITKTSDVTSASPGSPVALTLTLTNTGETPYTAAKVTDPLGGTLNDATYDGVATATTGVVSYTAPTLTWTGDLAVGQVVVINFQVRVNTPYLGDGAIRNTAVSDELGSSCPTGTTDPACTAIVSVHVPALDIAVTADHTTTVPGATVGYTITITNSGETGFASAHVTTALGSALDDATYNTDAVATTGAATLAYSAPNLTWTGDLAVEATVTIRYTLTVTDPDAGNKLLVTAATSSDPGSSCTTTSACTNTVTVLTPAMNVSTAVSVASATPGQQVVYTITLTNTGQTPYDAATLTTSLAGITDDATIGGEVNATIGNASYTAPNLTWAGALHPADPITLFPGDSATISYPVTVKNPDTGDKRMSMTVVTPAPGSNCQATSTNPACTASVTVLVPALSITKTASVSTTTPGGVVRYTIDVANTGQTDYTAAVVTDSIAGLLNDASYNKDVAVLGAGAVGYAGEILTWSGNLPVGGTASITYSVTVNNPATGDNRLTNAVTSTTPGATCPPGGTLPACSTLVPILLPALSITKTANTSAVVAGSAVTYTITVANTGETAYTPAVPARFTDSLSGVLDDATYAGDTTDTSATTGTISYTDDIVSWTGDLAVGASATIVYTVTTMFPGTGNHTLTNTAASTSPGANCATGADPRCASTVSVLVPALSITKTADTAEVAAGGTVGYTITATNTGQADYPNATIADSLVAVLDDAAYNTNAVASAGSVAYTSPTLTWTGDLAIGATVRITYSVATRLDLAGDAIMTNRVVSSAAGSTCTAGSANPLCTTSTTITARSITLTGLTPSFTLTGPPNTTPMLNGAVTMTVTTNSAAGYQVSVQARARAMTGALPANTATIPANQLSVRESGTADFQALSDAGPTLVHQQSSPSSAGGDAVSNDYRVQIPFVPPDTYTASLDYIASAQ